MGNGASLIPTISIQDFNINGFLGKGSFGKVCVCSHKQTGRAYALKYIKKRISHSDKVPRHALNERNVLEAIDHPCIANLKYSFQDSHYMYLLMDYFEAGDLRRHMTRLWEEDEIRVVAAELVSALDHIHGFGILHRDLKPENIMMDIRGHVCLGDWDLAIYKTKAELFGLAGTTAYICPEMANGQSYSFGCDMWSLGIVLFELFYGRRPFSTKNPDSLKANLEFPQIPYCSDNFCDIVSELLEKRPSKRLSASGAMLHPFFSIGSMA